MIRNVLIYISDAFRWDHTPDTLLEEGTAFKTVAASIDTSTSIPSMMTGLNPPRHGVYSFDHRLSSTTTTMFDLEGFDTGFHNAAGPNDGLNHVLRQDSLRTLDNLEPPFVYVERDHGGHHPYRGIDYDKNLSTFRKEFSGNTEKTRETYADAAEASVKRFQDRMASLEERGLLEETLCVFTSDHGELLGEHGWVGHLSPVYPEVVYVPTVFHHPDIEKDNERSFIGHIDLLPTLLSALDGSVAPDTLNTSTFDGVDVFGDESIEYRYNYAAKSVFLRGKPIYFYRATSLWDEDGGHVFNNSGWTKRLLSAAHLLGGNKWMCSHVRRTPSKIPAALKGYLSSKRTFGSPAFSVATAREYVDRVEAEREDHQETVELDEEVEEQLKELGYR